MLKWEEFFFKKWAGYSSLCGGFIPMISVSCVYML